MRALFIADRPGLAHGRVIAPFAKTEWRALLGLEPDRTKLQPVVAAH